MEKQQKGREIFLPASLMSCLSAYWNMLMISSMTPQKLDAMVTWSALRTTCLERLDERDGAAVQAEQLVVKVQALRDAVTTAITAPV